VALIATTAPLFRHPEPGVTLPPVPALTVSWYWVPQPHVTLEAALIVNVVEPVEPLDGTLPVPVQPVTTYWTPAPPLTGDATDSVTEPASTHVAPTPYGEGLPCADATVSWYWVFQPHATDEGAVIVKDPVDVPDPLDGADPVPVQPVATYCTPAAPATGEVTDDDTEAPELYHPAPAGEP
jgi:hypothetical protein